MGDGAVDGDELVARGERQRQRGRRVADLDPEPAPVRQVALRRNERHIIGPRQQLDVKPARRLDARLVSQQVVWIPSGFEDDGAALDDVRAVREADFTLDHDARLEHEVELIARGDLELHRALWQERGGVLGDECEAEASCLARLGDGADVLRADLLAGAFAILFAEGGGFFYWLFIGVTPRARGQSQASEQ